MNANEKELKEMKRKLKESRMKRKMKANEKEMKEMKRKLKEHERRCQEKDGKCKEHNLLQHTTKTKGAGTTTKGNEKKNEI